MASDPEARRRQIRRERIVFGSILAAVVVASIGLLAWNRWVEHQIAGTPFIPRREKITESVVLLQEYIRIDTSHHNEIDGARWLAAHLDRAHIAYEIIQPAPGRASLYARLKGKRQGDGLMLVSHIDVVGATPAGWTRPPFSGDIFLNQLWGRGALDMKSITICQLQAFLAVARKGQPERDVVFLAVADEEGGSANGMRWIVEHRPDVLHGMRYALNEGGVTETIGQRITYFGIEIGTKQMVALDLTAATQDQLRQARFALEPYFIESDADVVLPEVVRYFHAIAPYRFEPRDELDDLQRTVRTGALWRLPRPYRELVQNTLWAREVRKSGDQWVMPVIFLNLPNVDTKERLDWLARTVAPYGAKLGTIHTEDPIARLSSDQTPFFALIARVVRDEYDVDVGSQILARSENDSRFLRPHGIECYGMWPYPVDFYQTLGIHSVDERVRIDWFQQGVDVVKTIVTKWAFAS